MKTNKSYVALTIISLIGASLHADSDKKVDPRSDVQEKKVQPTPDMKIEIADAVSLNPTHEIRYVNAMEIIQRSEQGRKMAKEFEQKQMRAAQEFQAQREAAEREFREYTEKKVTLSEAAQRQEEKRLNRKKKDLESRAEELEQDLKVEMAQATERLYKELEMHVERIARAEGIDAVIDTFTGRPIYVAERLNYTDTILQAWNQGFEQSSHVVAQKEEPKETATA